MFNVDWLGKIREHEVQYFCGLMQPGITKILEIGGGTGHQALAISELGFDIVSIDVASSTYVNDQVFPVSTYDGKKIPFENECFDLVISSNTLEHIQDLDKFQSEICRILKPNGFCLHAMLTASWRFWTSLTHYIEMLQRLIALAPRAIFNRPTKQGFRDAGSVVALMARTSHSYLWPPRHGERGNFITELWYFSRCWWRGHFKRYGFAVCSTTPMGLFYTGHMLLNNHMPIKIREKLSGIFGSSCVLYEVRPIRQH